MPHDCTDGNACPLPNTQCQWPECRAPESGLGLLGRLGMDAAKWCAEMTLRGVVQADPTPGETFHGWMCNAIMTAHDIGFAAGERRTETERMLPLLKQSLLIARPWMWSVEGPTVEWEKWAEAVDMICGIIDRLSPKVDAIAAWNRRPAPAEIEEAVELLERLSASPPQGAGADLRNFLALSVGAKRDARVWLKKHKEITNGKD